MKEIQIQMKDDKLISDKEEENYKNQPIVSSIILGPIDRYRIYGIFPFKLLIHILLVLSTSVFMFIKNDEAVKVLKP